MQIKSAIKCVLVLGSCLTFVICRAWHEGHVAIAGTRPKLFITGSMGTRMINHKLHPCLPSTPRPIRTLNINVGLLHINGRLRAECVRRYHRGLATHVAVLGRPIVHIRIDVWGFRFHCELDLAQLLLRSGTPFATCSTFAARRGTDVGA